MFFHWCPTINSCADYAKITLNTPSTHTPREYVTREWGTGKVLKSAVDPQMVTKGVDNGYVGLQIRWWVRRLRPLLWGLSPICAFSRFSDPSSLLYYCTDLSLSVLPSESRGPTSCSTSVSLFILLNGAPQGVLDACCSRATQPYKSVNGGVDFSSPFPLAQQSNRVRPA